MRSRTIFAVFTILILVSCAGDEPAAPVADTMPRPATAPDVEAGMTILVTINDGHIATQQSSIPVGPAVLTVANAGKEIHDLHVEGPGVNAALEEPIGANGTGTVSVTFGKGEYTLYCPILDHREKGETLTLTIPTQE